MFLPLDRNGQEGETPTASNTFEAFAGIPTPTAVGRSEETGGSQAALLVATVSQMLGRSVSQQSHSSCNIHSDGAVGDLAKGTVAATQTGAVLGIIICRVSLHCPWASLQHSLIAFGFIAPHLCRRHRSSGTQGGGRQARSACKRSGKKRGLLARSPRNSSNQQPCELSPG